MTTTSQERKTEIFEIEIVEEDREGYIYIYMDIYIYIYICIWTYRYV